MAGTTGIALIFLLSGLSGGSAEILRVYTTLEKPYLMIKDLSRSGNAKYEGFFLDLMEKICTYLKLDFEIYTVEGPSYMQEDGRWTGIIKEITEGTADAGGLLPITSIQERVVDHSKPILSSGIVAVTARPEVIGSPAMWLFLKPFTVSAWIMLIVVITVMLLFIYLLQRFVPSEASNTTTSNPWCDGPLEIVCLKWTLLIFLLFAGFLYLATLTQQIPPTLKSEHFPPLPADSVDKLADQTEIRYGAVRGGAAATFLRLSAIPLYEKLWSQMSKWDKDVMVDSVDEGIEKVRNSHGEYVFIMDSAITADFYTKREPCDIVRVGNLLNSQGLAVVTPIGSPYRQHMDLRLLSMQESGEIYALYKKWFEPSTECPEYEPGPQVTAEEEGAPVSAGKLAGPLVLLVIGVGTALLILAKKKILPKKASKSEGNKPDTA